MKLQFLNGKQTGKTVELIPGFSVGRENDNDLPLPYDGISRHHCRFYKEGDNWVVEDQNSTNGVKVNGTRIEAPHTLNTGDEIKLHDHRFRLVEKAEEANVPPPVSPLSSEHAEGAPAEKSETSLSQSPVQATSDSTSEPANVKNLLPIIIIGLLIVGVAIAINVVKSSKGDDDTSRSQTNTSAKSQITDASAEEKAENIESQKENEQSTSWDWTPDDAVSEAEEDTKLLKEDETPSLIVEDDEKAKPAVQNPAVKNEDERPPQKALEIPTAICIQSMPPNATVLIDNEEVGKTPHTLYNFDTKRHRLTLKKEGYSDLHRLLEFPGKIPNRVLMMQREPGSIHFKSTPSGAAVRHKGQVLGHTPFACTVLPPGAYNLKFYHFGYETAEQKIELAPGDSPLINVELQPEKPILRVQSIPPACDIYINGTKRGRTSKALNPNQKNMSEPFEITGLSTGEMTVRVVNPDNGRETKRKVFLATGDRRSLTLTLYSEDTELIMKNGQIHRGMFAKQKGGVLTLLTKTGKKELDINQIETRKTLTPAQQKRRNQANPKQETPQQPPKREPPKQEPPAPAPQVPQPEANIQGNTLKVENMNDVIVENVATAISFMKKSSTKDAQTKYNDKIVTLTGVPEAVRLTRGGGMVMMAPRAKCEFSRQDYTELREIFASAAEHGTNITLSGRAEVDGPVLWLRACKLGPVSKNK
jgi:pSer/pThr/pTyr-binding forkhead associated (FHA) protein